MEGKKTILLINKSTSLNEIFRKALEEEGFIVTNFFEYQPPVFRKNIVQRGINIFYRTVLKDTTYLKNAEIKKAENFLISRSKSIGKNFDYALFFRADLFPEKMIQNIKNSSKKMITYQYDGMDVCLNLLNYTKYFDRIFAFDRYDVEQYQSFGLLPLTNCWFPDSDKNRDAKRDFFYVGVGLTERKKGIEKLAEYCMQNDLTMKAVLTIPDYIEEYNDGFVSFLHKGLSYEENMMNVKESNVLIDFKLPYHEGLSFRFFEAMNYEKKLITNNFSVKHYDFYHPNNIFICDYDSLFGLDEFLSLPYVSLDENIKKKYSFGNWIKYVCDLGDYQKIDV